MTKKFAIGAVLATAALVLSACAPSTTGGTGGGTGGTTTAPSDNGGNETPSVSEVTVGVITSDSGALESYGKQYLAGFQAGLDYVTDGTGEIDGIKINVEYRDDAGDVDTAVTAAKELIGAGVNILAGSASSGVALALTEQAEQNKVLFVSGPAAADAVTGVNNYTFRSGRQSEQDVATAGTFLENLEGSNVVVLAQQTAFGEGNVAAVDAILGAQGANIIPVLVPEDVTEFTAFAQQVLSHDPDLVFVAWAGGTSGAMWLSMTQQGVFDSAPVVTGLGDSPTYGAFGAASEEISFLNHYFAGAPSNAVNDAMVKAVEAAGAKPDLFTPDGFVGAMMVAEAIRVGQGDVDAMIAALEGYTFEGPKGTTTVRASDHALLQEMYQVRLVAEGDSFVPELVATVAAADVAPTEK